MAKKSRSERVAARARRRQNQRIFLIGVIVFAVLAVLYSLFGDQFQFGSSTGSVGDLITTASGLQYEDVVVGTGPPAQAGQEVTVHYVGTLEDGTQFDSSRDRGVPFVFPLGMGRVIAGWDEGVAGMQVGSLRILMIPGNLGYGAQGSPPAIPPHATLIFEVELLEILSP